MECQEKKTNQFITLPQSLVEIAEIKIREMIISGELEFGESITEIRLSEMFNLSKTPIREALLRLGSAERLVEIKARRGTFVFSLSPKEINDISSTRIVLEKGAIYNAMKCNQAQLLLDLSKNIKKSQSLLEKNNLSMYRALDCEFHQCLLEHTQNRYLIESYRLIFTKVQAMRNRLTFSTEYVRNSIAEHIEIVDTLVKNDIDLACKLIERHINNGFTERTRRLLSDVHKP